MGDFRKLKLGEETKISETLTVVRVKAGIIHLIGKNESNVEHCYLLKLTNGYFYDTPTGIDVRRA
jgi:hypothetical protein